MVVVGMARIAACCLTVAAVAGTAVGCGGSGDSGRVSMRTLQQHGGSGIAVAVPAGWKTVRLRNAPGADVPLQIASFDPHGAAVDDICNPGSRILGQIPAGDALLQLLEDHPRTRDRKEFPSLSRPFHLGRPEGHECGEAYNVFFRTRGRFFQLRIWTPENQQARYPMPPSPAVRGQIEAMMNSLRV